MNLRTLFYWLVISLPLAWGVAQSVNSAMPLFGLKSVYIPGFTVPPPAPPKPVAAPTVAPTPGPTP